MVKEAMNDTDVQRESAMPHPDRGRGRTALGLLRWAWPINAVAGLVVEVMHLLMWEVLNLSLGEWMPVISISSQVISLSTLGCMLAGTILLVRPARGAGAAGLLLGAAVAIGACLVHALFFLVVFQLLDVSFGPESVWGTVLRVSGVTRLAAFVAFVGLLLAGLHRFASGRDGRPAGGAYLAAAILAGLFLLGAVAGNLVDWGSSGVPWWVWAVGLNLFDVVLAVVMFWLLGKHAGLSGVSSVWGAPDGAGGEEEYLGTGWEAARAGLRLYRGALIAQISITVGGMLLLLLAALGRSAGFAKAVMVLVAVGSMLAGAGMFFGLLSYAKVPEKTGGRGAAVGALVIVGVVFLMGFYSLFLVFQILSGDHSAIRDAAEQTPWVEGIGQVLGLAGMLVLLFSFGQVGRYAGSKTVPARIGSMVALLLVTAVAALGLKVLVATRAIGGPGLLPIALVVLGLAIAVLVYYLRILKELLAAIAVRPASDGRGPRMMEDR